MIIAIVTIAALATLFGLLLGYAAVRFHVEGDPIAEQIDKLLPQTQCGQCGHPGCRPYAIAIANGEDDINRCAPGGEATIIALADLLGRDPVPMDEDIGEKLPSVALIIEKECIVMIPIEEGIGNWIWPYPDNNHRDLALSREAL